MNLTETQTKIVGANGRLIDRYMGVKHTGKNNDRVLGP
jgi:hypothetical protein